jgi:hypothetical protein
MTANSLIDNALQEIAKGYKPGFLMWLRSHPDGWARLLEIEVSINTTTLAGDEAGLKEALSAYREFFVEMTGLYGKGDTLPLFEGRR